ncbi:hypothetical protein E2C01_015895 [Portunus trituberculatus]|uniref:Uncharacterized protein n=1 Tax=Portunus trituberculatus TaxID=210409 RepID=A0A5B7DN47_PORTR|nr:hypothetical protein [Portunus trituberculatus]
MWWDSNLRLNVYLIPRSPPYPLRHHFPKQSFFDTCPKIAIDCKFHEKLETRRFINTVIVFGASRSGDVIM